MLNIVTKVLVNAHLMEVKCHHYHLYVLQINIFPPLHSIIHLRSMSDKMFTSLITISNMFLTTLHPVLSQIYLSPTNNLPQAHTDTHTQPHTKTSLVKLLLLEPLWCRIHVTFYINTMQNINFIVFSFII